ncbi:sodium:phosphate symporter [Pseudoclavibacter endophyticus]|uniref:Na/Pi cotransporter family protein n=1 Tax=Pseudoclavibacter endophyticus TaxID=1778590 RepID=A0A6H9WAE9_9MICO|nr:Na/Pi symporter [Pseudoclavibacter endophyticus]KAB1646797.1 Na/Pi cotransporter family protein [Pseudoclavibacter endophyticus]GGA75469.1 sodium:phosphate symporter [Pseudoclavibacter endophyticus]
MTDVNEKVAGRDTTEPEARAATITSPLSFIPLTGRAANIRDWIGVAVGVWLLITAVKMISSGFKTATGDQAGELFAFADNPLVALLIGLLATALTQSSSTTTSVTVGLVAGGMPMEIAIPMLMGANLGTTMTNTLVSLGMAGEKATFRRAFAAATVHDFFNVLAVAIMLPLEMMFGILQTSAGWLAGITSGDGGVVAVVFGALGTVVSFITEPLYEVVRWVLELFSMPSVAEGIILIALGIGLILFVINKIGQLLKGLMVGKAKQVLHTAIGRGPITGIFSGMVMTVMVQSSSTTTSLAVPLAGSGAFTLRQIYPFTVGSNVGTTITALISAFAFTGVEATLAMQASYVHLLFNVFAAIIIFGLPFLRVVPPWCAELLAKYSAERKWIALVWTFGVFLVLPLIIIALTSWVF